VCGRLANGAVGCVDVTSKDGLGTGTAVVGTLHHECAVVYLVLQEEEVIVTTGLNELSGLDVTADNSSDVGLLPKDRS